MDNEKILTETIENMKNGITRIDAMNQRLVTLIRIIVLAFLTAAVICFGIMYLSNYTTTTNMQQQQINGQMQQQSN